MTLDRKEFIKAASLMLVTLTQEKPEIQSSEFEVSQRYERIPLKGSIKQKLEFLKESGCKSVELNSVGYDREKMLALTKKLNLKISTVYHADNWVGSLSSVNEEERETAVASVLKSIETAEFYGAEYVQVLPGKEDSEFPEESKKSLLKSLKEITQKLKAVNLKVLLQNFYGNNFSKPHFWSSLFLELDEKKFGLCVDTSVESSGIGLSDWIKELKHNLCKLDINRKEMCRVRELIGENSSVSFLCFEKEDFRSGIYAS